MGAHLIDGEFQSDKYPTTPRGKVPLSVKDKAAQPLLWTYAQLHRKIDWEFSDDLETALKLAGYAPPTDSDIAASIRSTVARLNELCSMAADANIRVTIDSRTIEIFNGTERVTVRAEIAKVL